MTEHSVLVVAKYYTRISIKRLAELLDLPAAEAEKQLSDLVVSKAVCAKVDRPSGLIQFGKRKVRGGTWMGGTGWAKAVNVAAAQPANTGRTLG